MKANPGSAGGPPASSSNGGRAARAPTNAAIDRENPWPGLASFTEDSRSFFFGREKETEELVRLIRRNTLTVLFGQSGLGKSSLLQAGAFPLLREADFLPLYLRLDHSTGDAAPSPRSSPPVAAGAPQLHLSLADQVKSALVDAFKSVGADAPAPRADETLWEYFHRKDIDIWSAKNRLLTPVLAFDQFEEIFTLGRATDAQRERGRAFLAELADLVENRAPAALRARFDSGELDIARYNFDKPSCQVVLSLREDFLPDLEGLKHEMRSIMHSRMRVKRLNGTQALEIVSRPAPHLLADGVAERVVEFVAGVRGGSTERLLEMEVEPALLSVICRELNERRRALTQEKITTDLVSGNRREILTDFYERSVADLPEAMRAFVEDHLLTKSGFRDNLALETALEFPGVTRPLIDTLVSRRLVRIEDRLGVQRVELTHDVLAEVIRASRESRQQRSALAESVRRTRRLRWLVGGLAAAVAVVSAGAFLFVRSQQRSAQAAQRLAAHRASQTDLAFGSRLLEEGKVSDGLAYLVRAARRDPDNPLLAPRLITTLVDRSFLLPEGAPLILPSPARPGGRYSADGRTVYVQSEDQVIRAIDVQTWRVVREFRAGSPIGVAAWELASANDRVLAASLEDGSIQIFDTSTGLPRHGPLRPASSTAGDRLYLQLSPNGRWVAGGTSTTQTAWLWDTETGDLRATLRSYVQFLRFSPDSRSMVTATVSASLWKPLLRSVPEGTPIGTPMGATIPASINWNAVAWSPDGRTIAANFGRKIHVLDVATGASKGPDLGVSVRTNGVYDLQFTPDGRRLVVTVDRVAHVINLETGQPLFPALANGGTLARPHLSRDGKLLLTSSADGFARLWDMDTGKLRAEPTLQREHYAVAALSPAGTEVTVFLSDGQSYRLGVGRGARDSLELPSNFTSVRATFLRDHPHRVLRVLGKHADAIDITTGREAPGGFSYPQILNSGDDPTRLGVPGYLSTNQKTMVAMVGNPPKWRSWRRNEEGKVAHDIALEGAELGAGYAFGRFVPKDELVALFGGKEGERAISLWDLQTGERVGRLAPTEQTSSSLFMSFSRGAHLIAHASSDRVIHVREFPSGTERFALRDSGQPPIYDWTFNPDGKRIITGDAGGWLKFWDVTDGRLLSAATRHRINVNIATSSRDGRFLLTYSSDGTVQQWDHATGASVGGRMAHEGAIGAASFTPDGKRIVTATRAGEVRIWDAATSQPLTEPVRHEGATALLSVQISSDGRFFMTDGGSGSAYRVWSMPPDGNGSPVPEWLLQLATACASKRLTEDGELVSAADEMARIGDVRATIAALPPDAPFVEWGRWFLSDRDTRSIAPGFTVTPAEARKLAEERAAPHPLVALNMSANLLKAQGKFAEVEALDRQILALARERDGETSAAIAGFLQRLGETLIQTGKFEEAETVSREAIEMRETLFGAGRNANYLVATIGIALVGQKRYAEAEPMLLDMHDRFEKAGPHARSRMSGVAEALAKLYAATNQPEKAEEWKQKAAAAAEP